MPVRNATATVQHALRGTISSHHVLEEGTTLLVAVSGGADSLALLLGLVKLREPLGLNLHVAHFDHSLRAESQEDAQFVQQIAEKLGVPVTVEREEVGKYAQSQGLSLEDAARQRRYAFLSRTAQALGTDVVALGHTADDQVETVLLHLVRGSGLRGLRGMAPLTRLWEPSTQRYLRLFRPLLEVGREITETACQEARSQPREDPSNQSLRFTRNRLRHEVLPLLKEINPAVRNALMRLARTAGQDEAYLQAEAAGYAEAMHLREGGILHLDREVLQSMHPVLQGRLLQMAYQELTGPSQTLEQVHVEGMTHLMAGAPGRKLHLPNGVVFAMGYGECLLGTDLDTLCPLPSLPNEHSLTVPGTTRLDGWIVKTAMTEGYPDREFADGVTQAVLNADTVGVTLHIRSRRPGDRFQPIGMEGSKKLQDFFVDEKVPRTWRDCVPLVVGKQGIAWVVGYRLAQWAKVTGQTRRILEVTFHRTDEGVETPSYTPPKSGAN